MLSGIDKPICFLIHSLKDSLVEKAAMNIHVQCVCGVCVCVDVFSAHLGTYLGVK